MFWCLIERGNFYAVINFASMYWPSHDMNMILMSPWRHPQFCQTVSSDINVTLVTPASNLNHVKQSSSWQAHRFLLPDMHIEARLHPYSIQFAMSSDVCMTPASDDVISSHPDVTIPFAQNDVFQTSVTASRSYCTNRGELAEKYNDSTWFNKAYSVEKIASEALNQLAWHLYNILIQKSADLNQ